VRNQPTDRLSAVSAAGLSQRRGQRNKAHVPEAIRFKTKPQIASEQMRAAGATGVPRGVVLTNSSYGTDTALRASVSALRLTYVTAMLPIVKVVPRQVARRPTPAASCETHVGIHDAVRLEC
jgi:SRSO17 transposase